jgi:hypothetical protein
MTLNAANGYPVMSFQNNGTTVGDIGFNVGLGMVLSGRSTNPILFYTNSSERGRWDSSGRFLVGTSTVRNAGNASQSSRSPLYFIEGAGANAFSLFTGILGRADANGPNFTFAKTRSNTLGDNTIVQNGDVLGQFLFAGADGTDLTSIGASIQAEVDGTPGVDDMPGRLVFSTTADGASSPTERMRIRSDGGLVYGTGAAPGSDISSGTGFWFSTSTGLFYIRSVSSPVAAFNRGTDDGVLVEFKQDQTIEGTISVSGTTVSYNGAHLSRWSQLPSGAERIEILRGSVLSNIDEMCEWGEEDNEQLNRMKVSDVEGDKNVSGVFQAWDDDDDTYTNDFYCAMTGDFIIRIAEGVTVERGDLLMSAGDGTAKPQDDDIIRSKTIAKVTSTNVSCTYEDGSYCVPCVLMAC